MKFVAAFLAFGALALASACADFYDYPYGDSYYSGGYYGDRYYSPYSRSYGNYNYYDRDYYDREGRRSYRTCDERGCGTVTEDPRFLEGGRRY